MDWKTDREKLRAAAREKPSGREATMIYALIAHMRGRVHMRYYNKYEGGWRWGKATKRDPAPAEFSKAYGTEAQYYFERCVIENLEDQAEWIKQYLGRVFSEESEFSELAQRVLNGYVEDDARIARTAERQA